MTDAKQINELAAALVAAQSEMPAVSKSGHNTFDRYSYAKLEDYVKVIRPIFSKHGLSMITSVEAVERLPNRETKKGGTEYGAQVKINLTIMHRSGQCFTVSSFGEGQDRADKAIYKAITGARKYALASALGLATSDDPEAGQQQDDQPQQHEEPAAPPPDTRPAKVRLVAAISRWSGIASSDKEQFPAACGSAIRWFNKEWKPPLDDEKAAQVLDAVSEAIRMKLDWNKEMSNG